MAFSSEVDTGSREENASNHESRVQFRFNRSTRWCRASTPHAAPWSSSASPRSWTRTRRLPGLFSGPVW